MAKILLVSDNKDVQTDIQTTLLNHEFEVCFDEVLIADSMQVDTPDIVMLDSDIELVDIRSIYKTVKNFGVIILLIMREKEIPTEILTNAHLFVSYPLNKTLFKSAIKALISLYDTNFVVLRI